MKELRHRLSGLLVTGSVLAAALGTCAAASAGAAAASAATPQNSSVSGGTIKVCQCTNWLAADSNTGTLWLVNGKAKSISVVSEKTGKAVATIKLGPRLGPEAMGTIAVDPTSRTVWDFAGADLVQISDKTMKVLHIRSPRGYRPGFGGLVDPARGEVWVISEETIQGISESTGKVLSTVFLADGAKQDNINGLADDPKTGTVFASVVKFGATRTWLYAVNEASGTATVFRKLTGSSGGLTVDPAAGKVWNLKGTELSAYSATGQHKPSGSIAISPSRTGAMTTDPTTGSIWMAAVNVLTRFSESHRNVIRTLPLPGRPFGITVDSRSHTVFTLNSQNRVVQFYRY